MHTKTDKMHRCYPMRSLCHLSIDRAHFVIKCVLYDKISETSNGWDNVIINSQKTKAALQENAHFIKQTIGW